MRTLVTVLASRVCKAGVLQKLSQSKLTGDIFDDENLLPVRDVVLGNDIHTKLQSLPEKQKLQFQACAQRHFVAAGKHVIKKGLEPCRLLQHFKCLAPSESILETSLKHVENLVKVLPIKADESDTLGDEWRLYQLEHDLPQVEAEMRIDRYWGKIFALKNTAGGKKYPIIEKFVKMCLSMSHRNADVERSFSLSKRILSDDRASMNERTLNARLLVQDGLQQYGNCPELVPITTELLSMAHVAYKNYQNYFEEKKLKEEKKQKEKAAVEKQKVEDEKLKTHIKQQKRNIDYLEKELKLVKEEEISKKSMANELFADANKKLKIALKTKDINKVATAQAMIEAAENVRKDERAKQKEAEAIQKRLDAQKNNLLLRYVISDKKC